MALALLRGFAPPSALRSCSGPPRPPSFQAARREAHGLGVAGAGASTPLPLAVGAVALVAARAVRHQRTALGAAASSRRSGRPVKGKAPQQPKGKVPQQPKGKARKPRKVVTLGASDAKERLKAACAKADFRNGMVTKAAVRQEIDLAIEEVEILDSTQNPATTGAQGLTGKWRLLYSTADAIPGGACGPFFGEVTHELSASTQSQTLCYTLLSGNFRFDWTHEYRTPSTYEWELPNEDWIPVFFGIRFSLWSFSNTFKTIWELTYTDSDMRIIRARSGDTRRRAGNDVYVLERVQ